MTSKGNYIKFARFVLLAVSEGLSKREMFADQTPSNIVWRPNILPFGHLVWCRLIKQRKTFLLFSCLLGDVLFVWTAVLNMFGTRMRTTLSQRLVSIDTVPCLRTSLVQYFKWRKKMKKKRKKKKKKLWWTFLKMGR